MIDQEGFRSNVGIIIANKDGQLLWAKRCQQHAWQFPQGGVQSGESPEQAMYRELYEEVGLKRKQVRLLGSTKRWLKYRLPQNLIRRDSSPMCIGQKQKWFLLQLMAQESAIHFNNDRSPEFDGWTWVSYWFPLQQVISFKREVYRQALVELMPVLSREQSKLHAAKGQIKKRRQGKRQC